MVGADTETMWGVEVVLDLVSELTVVLGRGILICSPVKFKDGLVFWLLCLESDGRLSPSDKYEVVGDFSFDFSVLEQEPGPNIERSTGKRNRPWRKPREMTRKTILKKVTKMYEGAIIRPMTPRMVETAPCKIGKPRPYKLFLTLSSGAPSLSR